MSYEIIKHIKVDEKENTVFIQGDSNNVFPKDFKTYWKCESLEKILKKHGRMAMDIEILKTYESGSFQGGNSRYTSALKRLRNMPEYEKFNWRNSTYDYQTKKQFKIDNDYDGLLRKALTEKNPTDRYVISKKYGNEIVYAEKKTKCRLFWTHNKSKAKKFHYIKEAEQLKMGFEGSKYWEIELISTKNLCSKTVSRENAYEVWQSHNKSWTWYVLKKWQVNDNKQYARWFCDVVTPICPDGELGDVYVKEIKENAIRIK